jgi:hydroxymethylbilane synthase
VTGSRGPRRLRLATRGSALALAQATLVAEALRRTNASIEVEIVRIQTEGDADRTTPLSVLGGRGVFVRGVEDALLGGQAEIAVHSLKDVPTATADGLTLGAMLPRADPRDALIASDGRRLAALPAGARIGTSSQRRAALLHALRPDIEVVELRGNVDTRLRRVAEGSVDGLVLAAAGLERLGRLAEATQLFEVMEFLPAPGQGVIAIECRADDMSTLALLALLDDTATRVAAEAERGFLAALGTGCSLPVGAYAQVDGDLVALRAMLADEAGGAPLFGDASGTLAQAAAIGRGLGERLQAAVAGRPA